jgi:metacaspase-1
MRTWVRMFGTGLAAALAASGVHAESRALLIGVGDVQGHPLPAIDLDLDNMKKVAVIMGFKPDDIKVLFNEQATAADVKQALGTWVRAGVGPDDRVLIYFSGHGTRAPDAQSANGVDDALVMHDAGVVTVNGKASVRGLLLGRELGAALRAIPSRNVLVLVDACHSGTATRNINLGTLSLGSDNGVSKFFDYPGMPAAPPATTTRDITLSKSAGSENYASVSAAQDNETATGTDHGGLFTLGVVETIQGASRDGKHPTVEEVRAAASAYIAAHQKDDPSHPMVDGNPGLIRGALDLVPLKGGQGPTWQSLVALAGKGQPLTISSGAGRQIKVGEQIVLEVKVPRAGYLNVVTVDSQDRATVLYPNKYNTTNEVQAGTFRFPTADMNFVVRAAEPLGPSLVVAFLSDKKVNLLDMGIEGRNAAGKMESVFTEVSARGTRALVIEARENQVAGGTLVVRVDPAAH